MTEEKDKDKDIKNSGEKVLKLGDVSDFTIGEIVNKAQRVDKENSESESALDKYIRQHRGEIEAVKNQALEKYIRSEREKMDQEVPAESSSEAEETSETSEIQETVIEEVGEDPSVESDTPSKVEEDPSEATSEENKFKEKNKNEFDEVEIVDDLPPVVPAPPATSDVKAEPEGVPEAENVEEDFPELSNEVPDSNTPSLEESEETESSTPEVSSEDETEATEEQQPEAEAVYMAEKMPVAGETVPLPLPVVAETETEAAPKEERVEKKNSKKPLIIGLCVLVLLAAGGTGYAIYNHNNNQKATEQANTANKENLTAFNKAYDEFFTDSDHTLLKNSNFDQLSALKTKLEKLKGNDFDTAEKKVNALEPQIKAVQKVNALFNKSVIVDGKLDDTAQVKAAVSIPAVPKTANESLNKVLAKAISLAKTQQADAKAKEEQAAAQSNNSSATADQSAGTAVTPDSATNSTQPSADAGTSQTEQNASQGSNATGNVAANGAQNPTGATPDNSNARVQPQANLNLNDPAFTWKPGIMDKVLNIARQRGYISGNNFILLPVAIHTMTSGYMAGQVAGYFNLYRPDGSYLLTINNKTGYFFGNGKGLPTDFE